MERSGCLKGCATGCAVVLVIGVALLFLGGVKIADWMSTFDEAIEAREALEARYPSLETYVPPGEGVVPAERLERFLAVRGAIQPACARLTEVVTAMDGAIDEMDAIDQSEGDPGLRDVPWSALSRTIGSALSLAPEIGRFAKARNDALIENEMGFGEYAWLFSMLYRFEPEVVVGQQKGVALRNTTLRVRQGIIEMMRRHLAALEDSGGADGGADRLAEALEREIAALDADPDRPLWFDGLPDPLAAALEPFEARAEELACPEIRELELSRNRRERGLTIRVD